MLKTFYYLSIILFSIGLNAQVGINTETPQSTLDVNGNVIIRQIPAVNSMNSDYQFLIRDTSSNGDNEIKQISNDALFNSNTAYYATKSGSWSLLNLTIGGGWQKLDLSGSADTKLGNPALFTNGVYTAVQKGLYSVSYELQLESGINIEALGGQKLGILKNNAIWEEKSLDGVRISLLGLSVASLPVTSTNIQSVVLLNIGDTITFAVNATGLANIGLLTSSKVNLYIYKISN